MARELLRLDGNRIWRVDTPQGPVLQKLYAERGSLPHAWGRELASRLRGGKTSTRAAARRATEKRLLALWRARGCDVPAEVSAQHPDLANERTLVLEFIDGPLLLDVLADPAVPRERRHAWIERFAAEVSRRHTLALQHGEAALVHEHGGVQHVLLSGPVQGPPERVRLFSFDLENTFEPRRELLPLVAKEIASCLRSLLRGRRGADGADAALCEDLAAFARGYGAPERLRASVANYLDNPSPLWRLIWRIDRWREDRRGRPHGKHALLRALDAVLREGGSS